MQFRIGERVRNLLNGVEGTVVQVFPDTCGPRRDGSTVLVDYDAVVTFEDDEDVVVVPARQGHSFRRFLQKVE